MEGCKDPPPPPRPRLSAGAEKKLRSLVLEAGVGWEEKDLYSMVVTSPAARQKLGNVPNAVNNPVKEICRLSTGSQMTFHWLSIRKEEKEQ